MYFIWVYIIFPLRAISHILSIFYILFSLSVIVPKLEFFVQEPSQSRKILHEKNKQNGTSGYWDICELGGINSEEIDSPGYQLWGDWLAGVSTLGYLIQVYTKLNLSVLVLFSVQARGRQKWGRYQRTYREPRIQKKMKTTGMMKLLCGFAPPPPSSWAAAVLPLQDTWASAGRVAAIVNI